MKEKSIGLSFLVTAMVFLLFVVSYSVNKELSRNDVNCVIGINAKGYKYEASIDLLGKKWKKLTYEQKTNVIDQCYLQIEDMTEHPEKVKLTGREKKTKKLLFKAYKGKRKIK